jgi:hypothetical protein
MHERMGDRAGKLLKELAEGKTLVMRRRDPTVKKDTLFLYFIGEKRVLFDPVNELWMYGLIQLKSGDYKAGCEFCLTEEGLAKVYDYSLTPKVLRLGCLYKSLPSSWNDVIIPEQTPEDISFMAVAYDEHGLEYRWYTERRVTIRATREEAFTYWLNELDSRFSNGPDTSDAKDAIRPEDLPEFTRRFIIHRGLVRDEIHKVLQRELGPAPSPVLLMDKLIDARIQLYIRQPS